MTRTRAAYGFAVVSAIALLVATPSAQIPRDATGAAPAGTASITGVVVAADTGAPLRRVQLRLSGATATGGAFGKVAASDDQGQFVFDALPPGQFTVDANRDQFLAASYGQKKPGRPGTPVDLGAAQRLRITIPMTRGGVITGTVLDDQGEPLLNARVRALRFVLVNGFRRLRSAGEVRTDDRGVYRIFGLEPGEYLVSGTQPSFGFGSGQNVSMTFTGTGTFSVQSDMTPMAMAVEAIPEVGRIDQLPFAPTFYPGAATPAAALRISVEGGVERSGVDIRILPIRTGIIQGVVSGIPGPNVAVQVLLQGTDPSAEPTTMTTNARATGEFMLSGVQPGSYVVYAQTLPSQLRPTIVNGPNGSMSMTMSSDAVRTTDFARLHGRTPVVVDGERASVVTIALQPGRPISGHVTFALAQRVGRGAATTISIAPIPQNPQLPAFNTSPQTDADADGNFTLPGIRPGRYILRASGPGSLKSAMLNGEDTLDVGLEVTADTDVSGVELTLTDRLSILSGTIVNAEGKPAVDNTIVVAPTDSSLWRNGSRRITTTRPTTDGRYVIRGLPAGEYSLAAVSDIEAGEQFEPEFLRGLASASVRVTITDGGATSQNLKVAQ